MGPHVVMVRKPKPYTQRPGCSACRGKGTHTTYDHKEQKHKITECPACRGSGKA